MEGLYETKKNMALGVLKFVLSLGLTSPINAQSILVALPLLKMLKVLTFY